MIAGILGEEGKEKTFWKLQPGGIIIELEQRSALAAAEPGLSAPEKISPDQPDLYHVSYFINDMDQTVQLLTYLWGLGPWRTVQQKMEKDWIELVSKEPCEIKLAFTKLGPIVLELIQPVAGESYWTRFIQEKGEGLNHLAFSVGNWRKMASELEAAECKMSLAASKTGCTEATFSPDTAALWWS